MAEEKVSTPASKTEEAILSVNAKLDKAMTAWDPTKSLAGMNTAAKTPEKEMGEPTKQPETDLKGHLLGRDR